jgi:beta-N-acetylhexosaminidase
LTPSAIICGFRGQSLSSWEESFFSELNPWGYILFQRNCRTPTQIRRLTDSLRELSGRSDLPILIDQEGGRVQRLRPPRWREANAAADFESLYEQSKLTAREALFLNNQLIAHDLVVLGITVNCTPVLDLPIKGSHDIVGDRAYSNDPAIIADLGRVVCDAHLAMGVLPVLKHIPGHGRALADSHLALPRVSAPVGDLEQTDFAPFRALNDMPLAMTAHVVFQEIDSLEPATTSKLLIDQIIRASIGFQGLLMSDDLSMRALSGTLGARTERCYDAGCDMVLHCNGKRAEMLAVAEAARPLAGDSAARAIAALSRLTKACDFDQHSAEAKLDSIMIQVGKNA